MPILSVHRTAGWLFFTGWKTVYMETGIRSENLSQKLQKQAENGIGFADEESLLTFGKLFELNILYPYDKIFNWFNR